ncbi:MULTISPECIES: hypothetical protein [Kribbella]|nr:MULTISPECIES: hypothetical protein [Kribbella]
MAEPHELPDPGVGRLLHRLPVSHLEDNVAAAAINLTPAEAAALA